MYSSKNYVVLDYVWKTLEKGPFKQPWRDVIENEFSLDLNFQQEILARNLFKE